MPPQDPGLLLPGCIAGAYVVGGIPFGVLLGRLHGVDVRAHGSHNVGATNVGRVLGRRWGFLCFALDALKGAVPVLLAGWLLGAFGSGERLEASITLPWIGVAAAALVGHMFSPFLRFTGGKGVATGFGALAAMWPVFTPSAVAAILLWVVVVLLTRYVSLGSILAALSLPATVAALALAWPAWNVAPLVPLVTSSLLALLVVVKHRANIGRLLRGEELRVGSSRAGTAAAVRAPHTP
ncbi:MAG: glycerol-3-phosphate 1-O-acyltransferase PlsY [Phycisphaerales bacterium]